MHMYPSPAPRATPTAAVTPATADDRPPLVIGVTVDELARQRDLVRDAGWKCCRLAAEADDRNVRRGLFDLANRLAGLVIALERRLPEHASTPGDRVPVLPITSAGR